MCELAYITKTAHEYNSNIIGFFLLVCIENKKKTRYRKYAFRYEDDDDDDAADAACDTKRRG